MNKLRVYLDTSVINFVFADDAPELQRFTLAFFSGDAKRYDLFVSKVVVLEIAQTPDRGHREKLLAVLKDHRIQILSEQHETAVQQLANYYLHKGVIPREKVYDALHIAYATVFAVDLLLSWNFRHLANVNKRGENSRGKHGNGISPSAASGFADGGRR